MGLLIPMQIISKKEVSLYFHIPFCYKKCPYCHFYVVSAEKHPHEIFVNTLIQEWLLVKPLLENYKIVSIYFGGGTPTVLDPKYYKKILNAISKYHSEVADAEITIEGNPDRLSASLLSQYRAAGINRLSLGIQSLDDSQLKIISRTHDSNSAIRVIREASQEGFNNISCDLMYDLPDQTLKTWEKSVYKLSELPITHISIYNLTFEPKTVFGRLESKLKKRCPSEEVSEQILNSALDILKNNGFERYEISAFAKDKAYSRHNIGYWQGRPFMGIGPSAFSYWNGARFSNISNIVKWQEEVAKGIRGNGFFEKLDGKASRRELLSIALRTKWGVIESQVNQICINDTELENVILGLIDNHLLEWVNGYLKLTSKGSMFYDTVAQEIIY